MIHRGAPQMAGATAANAKKFLCCNVTLPRAADTSETLFQSSGDGPGHAFASFLCESSRELVSLRVFDI